MKQMSGWNEGDWIAAIGGIMLIAVLTFGGLVATRRAEEVAGHPRGLFVLFYAEMWERFSYYGMRALLILYLTKHWMMSDGKANVVYGAYTSLVYITPVLGGVLADRWLGQRKAVFFGGVLIAFGHALMTVEGRGGEGDPAMNVFWLALALIIVGTGFLKGNISVIVGQLYKLTDVRRDGAYTIFYMGINIGAALGTILVGYLGETLGWGYGFGLAGVGMVAGLIIFTFGRTLYGLGVAAVAAIWLLIQFQSLVGGLLIGAGALLFLYVLYEASKQPKEPRERLFAIVFLLALNPVFWGLYEQAGGSLNLFTDRFVDRQGVPASLFQSINPIYIVLLGPVFAALWTLLGKRRIEPSAPAKFGLALLQVGFSFLVLVWGAEAAGIETAVPVIYIFLIYLIATTGELCLSPVGLSAMNRLAPKHIASLIMGAWFFATAAGDFIAGMIGRATGGESGEMSKATTLAVYTKIGWLGIALGLVVLVLAPLVRRWMHLDTLKDEVPA
jgi:proton-dependent oligopeptide transporter, POT family